MSRHMVQEHAAIAELVAYVEPWDVDGVIGAYDALGRPIRLHADGVVRTRWTVGGDRTRHTFAPGEDRSAELARTLSTYLEHVGAERTGMTKRELDAAPLATLVDASHGWARS